MHQKHPMLSRRWLKLRRRGLLAKEWMSDFPSFVKAIGPFRPGKQLAPVKDGQPIGPGNWRWADKQPGTCTPRAVTLDGVTMTVNEHAIRLGLTRQAVEYRLKHPDWQRAPRRVTLDNLTMTIREHAARLGVNSTTVYNRLQKPKRDHRVALDGINMTIKEHAARLGISYGAAYRRLKRPRGNAATRDVHDLDVPGGT
jgi:predicted DNA-binding protein (UPF0251 family)